MKVSLDWLREYTPVDASMSTLVQALVDTGTEVKSVERTGQGVIVARVTALTPVPESTRGVQFADLDAGTGAPVRVLTGAANLSVGDLVPWAPPGTQLPGSDQPLGVRAMFGGKYQSPGMLCSAMEVGLGEDAAGILLLEQGQPGQPLDAVVRLDTVLDLEVTTNRPDCLCHLGIAREAAAALGQPLREPSSTVPAALTSAASGSARLEVEIEDPVGCPRFCACIIEDVRVGPSPEWLQRRLRAIGQRPINNVVDVTNYVRAELGQPLHAFDFDRFLLSDPGSGSRARVRVRRGRNETVECLDGEHRQVGDADMVVCSGVRAVSVAGIIGGRATAVDDATRTVLLEAACWDPPSIRATSRRLSLRTDASALYEKGPANSLAPLALGRAAALIAELGHGFVLRDPVDQHPTPEPEIAPIAVNSEWIGAVLGIPVDPDHASTLLAHLGFEVEHEGVDLTVRPPHFRRDVRIPEDVVEEVGRALGYARLPSTLPGRRTAVSRLAAPAPPEELVSEICVGAGFDEVITYSFVPSAPVAPLRGLGGNRVGIRLRNPLSEEWSTLRTSVLPGVVTALASNLRHGATGLGVFEIGRVFWEGERIGAPAGSTRDGADKGLPPLPREPLVLALARHAAADAPAGEAALRRLQAVIDRVCQDLGGITPNYSAEAIPGLHPGRAARVRLGDVVAGVVGELDSAVVAGLDARGRIVVAELLMDVVLPAGARVPRYAPPPRLPAVVQDLAVTVPAAILAGTALEVVRTAGGELLEEVTLYDQYRDQRMGTERKGWTFRLTFRASDHTLTGAEAQAIQARVVASLQRECAAEVRT